MRIRTVLGVGVATMLFAGGGIALAGNASAADNTSVRVFNNRNTPEFADITFCVSTPSGSKRCANEIGKGRHGTVGIEIQSGEEITIEVVKGRKGKAFISPEPGKDDVLCRVNEGLSCKLVDKNVIN